MTDPITEINTATRQHFMPVVTNQIFRDSPVLYRIFRPAKAGGFGLALPSFDGRSIAEPLELGEVAQEKLTYAVGDITGNIGNSYVSVGAGGNLLTAGVTANQAFIVFTDNVPVERTMAIKGMDGPNNQYLRLENPLLGEVTGKPYVITYYKDVADASGSYGKNTEWGAGTGDILGAAEFAWKMYHNTIKIHNLDTEVNKGRERMLDIVALKMRNAMRRLRKDLITDFYSTQADGGNAMIGLQAICAKTGLVGNIQKAKYGWWQGNVEDKDAALDWDILNTMWYATKKYGNADPATLIIVGEGALQKYEDELSKVVVTGASGTRYRNIQLQIQAERMRKTFDGGFNGFAFKGIPMIADPLLPTAIATKAFFINEKYVHWRILKAFESTGWQQLRSQGKDWAQMTIHGYGALTSSCNRKFGQINGLTEA